MRLGKVREVQDDLIRIEILSHSECKGSVGEDFSVESKHFRKATDEEVAKFKNEYIPKEGDIVVITGNTNVSINKVGDIGRVGERLGNKGVQVHVTGKPNGLLGGNYTKFDEMRPATEEEKKQYKQAEKFAKLGRKPGEIKKGDLVRITDRCSAHSVREGDIVEAKYDGDVDRFVDSKHEYYLCGELVAPVESRVDLDD